MKQDYLLRIPLGEPMLDEIASRTYAVHDPTRKPPHYLSAYELHVGPWRQRPLSILEMGVNEGGSIRVWLAYFPKSRIVGLDMNPMPATFPDDPRCCYVEGRQDDPSALARACAAGSPFDLIIDDAAHVGRLAKVSLHYLFRDHLAPGGLYVLEDYGAGLAFDAWADAHAHEHKPDVGDHLPSYDWGMVGMVKQLIDHTLPKGALARLPIAHIDIHPAIAFVFKA